MSEPLLLTKPEAATTLRISCRKLERLIATRSIRALKIGRHVRIEPAELTRFVAKLKGLTI